MAGVIAVANGNREWPRGRANGAGRGSPTGFFKNPDGYQRSDRSLAGPLRTGTSADVGPRARGVVAGGVSRESDFGMDRVTPRHFDPMGTCLERYGEVPSGMITEDVNGRKK